MATDLMRFFSVLFVDCWEFFGIEFPMLGVSIGQVLIWCSLPVIGICLLRYFLFREFNLGVTSAENERRPLKGGSIGFNSNSKK